MGKQGSCSADLAGRRSSTIQRQLVKKGSVLLTRMESITTYKNQHGQRRSGTQDQSNTPVSANDMCALEEWPSHARRNHAQLQDEAGGQKKKGRGVLKEKPEAEEPDCITLWELTHTKNGTWSNTESHDVYDKACEEVKNKDTETQAAFQQRNSEVSHQVNDLQDQLQAERANTQVIINLERAEREQLEEKLKEERAERERLLEVERTSRLKFEKNMMAKFAEFSKQMGTQQVFTNRIDKENRSK
ncbi:hypothetical protein ZWY2020_040258 [Hordeum vulgare]|nr:hypothetical protein ZWY2020_040258 [Hordeum vulgare]